MSDGIFWGRLKTVRGQFISGGETIFLVIRGDLRIARSCFQISCRAMFLLMLRS